MITQTLPASTPTRAAKPDLMHLVCGWDCNDNLALCGLDVTTEPWGDNTEGPHVCVVCDELDARPCPSPTCPGRLA